MAETMQIVKNFSREAEIPAENFSPDFLRENFPKRREPN